MTKTLIIFFFAFAHYNSRGQSDLIDDSLCNKQIELAKKDFSLGEYKFCVSATWDLPFSRMYDILDSLCKRQKLVLLPDTEPEHCTTPNPFLCYSNFMDSVIAIKFGKDFKSNLIKKADLLFVLKHFKDTIPFYHCDTQIKYPKGSDEFEKIFFDHFKLSNICRSTVTDDNGTYNVSFIVDLNGRATNYEISNAGYAPTSCIAEIHQKLLSTAKKFKYWKPATLGNKKVSCYSNLFIDIYRKHVVIE